MYSFKMNKKLLLIICLFVISFNFISYKIINLHSNREISIILESSQNRLEDTFESLIYNQKVDANVIYKTTIRKENMLKILSIASKEKDKNKLKILRNKLYDILEYDYSLMKNKGVLQYHFVLPDNKVFLRMHKPDFFADDMSIVRPDFKFVNDNKKVISGFSQGKISHSFRNIFPIFDKQNNYIGALDISYSTDFIQNFLTKVAKLHSHFLVNKNIFDVKTGERDDIKLKYIRSSEHKNYMLTLTSNHNLKKCLKENSILLEPYIKLINQKFLESKKFSIYDGCRIISFLPISNNLTNKNEAWLVSYKENRYIRDINNIKLLINIILFLLSLIVSFFVYREVQYKNKLRFEVKKKTKNLQKLSSNLKDIVKKKIQKNREKDHQLNEQSKSVQMGEMIANIAHQWRQPLSVISTLASGVNLKKSMSVLTEEDLTKTMDEIVEHTNYLSETINTFRDFIREDKVEKDLILQDVIKAGLSIVGTVLKDMNIKLVENINDLNPINIKIIGGELSQVIINVINNAKDVLVERNIKDATVFIELKETNTHAIIVITDNAGGIPEHILPKIFDPYFTTKHKSQGTGLGLHMSKRIVSQSLKGDIYVKNNEKGAEFTIKIPKKKD